MTSQGLTLRGENEHFGSNKNGNFLVCLEFIAEFDPSLSACIAKYRNHGQDKTSYLSSITYNEFIELMTSRVNKVMTDEAKASKYYSIIVDSSPDISHVDELALIIRYVGNKCIPTGRFIEYILKVGTKLRIW